MSHVVNVTIDDADDFDDVGTVVYQDSTRFPWSHLKAQGGQIYNGTLSQTVGPGMLLTIFTGEQSSYG